MENDDLIKNERTHFMADKIVSIPDELWLVEGGLEDGGGALDAKVVTAGGAKGDEIADHPHEVAVEWLHALKVVEATDRGVPGAE